MSLISINFFAGKAAPGIGSLSAATWKRSEAASLIDRLRQRRCTPSATPGPVTSRRPDPPRDHHDRRSPPASPRIRPLPAVAAISCEPSGQTISAPGQNGSHSEHHNVGPSGLLKPLLGEPPAQAPHWWAGSDEAIATGRNWETVPVLNRSSCATSRWAPGDTGGSIYC